MKKQMNNMQLIQGVEVKYLKPIPDDRGRVMEILRCDDKLFEKFGQVYITTAYPNVVKAWHYHKKQYDNFCVVSGMMMIALYDPRKNSPTYKKLNVFYAGIHNPILIKIPPLVFHGFKCISENESILVNIPSEPYNHQNPDEYRLPAHTKKIPFSWELKHR